jgi:RNA polymerase sigma-70 factor (ECF subfamily)
MTTSSDAAAHWCETIYDTKAAELVLYGRALGLTHGEAEDVLHDTFCALMRMEVPPGQPIHYLIRSFRNRALNHQRGRWRRWFREKCAIDWFVQDHQQHPAEAEAMRRLAALAPEQREVIVLKLWHELTFEEIGSLLDISPNTAAGRYRYGLQHLRAALTRTDYECKDTFGNPPPVMEAAATLPSHPA